MKSNGSPKFVISACLIGCPCRYDGKDQFRSEMENLYKKGEAIALCPEELAGLGTPRPPCERTAGGRIVSIAGEDKSNDYKRGAESAIELLDNLPIEGAFLKSHSPMCGFGEIYDGRFSGKKIVGKGVFAELLHKKGIKIFPVD